MSYDYKKSIWGSGTATAKWTDPANVRLRRCLKALALLSKDSKVLEVGCGAGSFTRGIKSIRPDLNVTGADISAPALDLAQKIGGGIVYNICGSDELPYGENEFDAVVIFDVLEHVGDPLRFLSEIKRTLKPDGIFYAFVPCENDITSFWRILDKLGLKQGLTNKYAGHIQFFTRKELLKIVDEAGFEVARLSYAEHLLGQIIGVAVFKSMDKYAKKAGGEQLNNEIFFQHLGKQRLSAVKKMVNWLITFESTLFSIIPSPNVHILARNKKRL